MTAHEIYLATGFRDVYAGESSKISRCLQFMQDLPCFQSYKRESLDRLQLKSGATAIDLGCGQGADVLSIAQIVGPLLASTAVKG